uniref:Reverse transcriptase domain-containing protein n=1 Tax=Haemonchus contortus TaxID=6289 RepID=A0A7I4YDU4_HAECO
MKNTIGSSNSSTSARKAETLQVAKRRLTSKTLELIRQRGIARVTGNHQQTSELAKLCREAIKEDLKERRAAVMDEASEAFAKLDELRQSQGQKHCGLYDNFTTRISPFYEEVVINVKRGVRQGDTIPPRLSAALENIMRHLEWEDLGVKVGGRYLHHLCFTGDIVLITPNIEQAERMLTEIDNACGKIGLKLNLTKTMFMKNGSVPDAPFTGLELRSCAEQLGKITKLSQWVPHELSAYDLSRRMVTCIAPSLSKEIPLSRLDEHWR